MSDDQPDKPAREGRRSDPPADPLSNSSAQLREAAARVRRADAGERARREFDRRARREPADRFWRAVALTGSVGWPIVLLAIGGVALGRLLDARVGTGVRFTLLLLSVATALGTWMAFRTVRREAA